MAYLSCFRPPSRQASEKGSRSLDPRLGLLSKSINRPLSLDVQNIGPFGTSIIHRLSRFKHVNGQPTSGPEVPLSSVTDCADETPPRVHISPSLDRPRFDRRLCTPYPWGDDGCPSKGKSISRQRPRMTGEHSQNNSFCHPVPTLSRHPGRAEFEPYAEWLAVHLCNVVSSSAFTQPE